MINRLISEISDYVQYLKSEHGDYVSFHNDSIPLQDYLSRLGPYNISSCPYCSYVKSDEAVWNRCIEHQRSVFDACSQGPFCGTCHAGVGEYVFPVSDFDGSLLGYVSLGGYGLFPDEAMRKMSHLAEKYGLSLGELRQVYRSTVRREPEDAKALRARAAPLCSMFVLLHHGLKEMGPRDEELYERDLLSRATVYIRRHYTGKITAGDIASHCSCSVSTISHLFKKQTRFSVPEYVRRLRIDGARQFLEETSLDISQISHMLGFSSPNYFSEIFKSQTGYSPKEYRKNEKNIRLQQHINEDPAILPGSDSGSHGTSAGVHHLQVQQIYPGGDEQGHGPQASEKPGRFL